MKISTRLSFAAAAVAVTAALCGASAGCSHRDAALVDAAPSPSAGAAPAGVVRNKPKLPIGAAAAPSLNAAPAAAPAAASAP